MPTLIQSIGRCMMVLEAINLSNGATIAELCAETGLTRGTCYRILETLRQEGFLRKDVGSAHYWLAQRVRSLSDGYQDEWWIDAFARGIVEDLGEQTRWPVKLLTLSGQDMLVRVTTDFASPFTDGKYPTGLRISLVWSAAGRCYLAFCDDADRQILLKMNMAVEDRLRPPPKRSKAARALAEASARAEGQAAADRVQTHHDIPPDFDDALATIRADGYDLVHTPGAVFFTLAVPVLAGELVLGALAIHIFRAVMRPADAVVAYLPSLRTAALAIAEQFEPHRAARG